jgi:hypothetical protein
MKYIILYMWIGSHKFCNSQYIIRDLRLRPAMLMRSALFWGIKDYHSTLPYTPDDLISIYLFFGNAPP